MSSIRCPHCQTLTTMEPKDVQGTVFTYSGESGKLTRPQDGVFPVSTNARYPYTALSVVACRGCGRDFLMTQERAVWPLDVPATPEGTPDKVAEAYRDARTALAAGAPIAAVMAARTALYRMMHEQEVTEFKALVPKGVLTATLYGGADQVRGWADVAGHGNIDVDELNPAELEDLLNYMATVLEAVYTQPARVARFANITRQLERKAPPPSKAAKPKAKPKARPSAKPDSMRQ